MIMLIHAYLSKNEVIGLLGGKIYKSDHPIKYQTTKSNELVEILVISKIYPTESCIRKPSERLKNCEISYEEQIRITDQMDRDGVQKLAWFHSHPFFEVDPSQTDLYTHCRQQQEFDKDGLPFFGVIVGPYSQKQEVNETQVNIFNLAPQLPGRKQNYHNMKDKGKGYHYKIIPKTKVKYSTYLEIKKMIKKSSEHKHDKPEFMSEWTNRR